MGLTKRIFRLLSGHKVQITGDITVAIGKVSPPELSGAQEEGRGRQTSLSKAVSKIEGGGFKVRYFLHVEIDMCRGLGSSDHIGLSDPFVIAKLNGVEFARSSVKSNTLNPTWTDSAFEIPVFRRITEPIIQFQVWDMDSDGVGDFLGEAIFNVNNNVFDLNLYPSTDTLELTTATLELKDSNAKYTDTPSFFEDHNVVLHRCSSANRLVKRRTERSMTSRDLSQAHEDVESSKPIIFLSIFVIVAYLAITYFVINYWLEGERLNKGEALNALDTIYFAVVTFTTVGYGDLSPETDGGKIFSMFHALCGVMMIGSGFTVLLKQFVAKELSAMETTQAAASDLLVGSLLSVSEDGEKGKDTAVGGGQGRKVEEHSDSDSEDDISTAAGVAKMQEKMKNAAHSMSRQNGDDSVRTHEEELKRSSGKLAMMWFVSIFTFIVGGALVGTFEDWNWVDSIYWVIITATSIGYGDPGIKTDEGKWVCLLFCPFAVGLMSASIGQTVQLVFENRATKQAQDLFLQDFAIDDFIHMSAKDTDKVTRAEFLAFMLCMMKKVDQGLMNRLNAQFDMLDADSNGFLEPVDLEIIKKKKTDIRRGAVAKHHAFNSSFRNFHEHDFSQTVASPRAGKVGEQRNIFKRGLCSVGRSIGNLSPHNVGGLIGFENGDEEMPPTPPPRNGYRGSAGVNENGNGNGRAHKTADIEMGDVGGGLDMSPPMKDHEEGLYFFDASP
ncbi:hypothetical protein TL16_g07097 [Triparma laevis f. inornata]|uniref:C2 domain-containing protein n=1 Tax=Triparma laevis f. inornata TaxID=1714386 RepID=A0A9W7ECP7_9STRA|nr:hypothetical protein TL16_g07097 [Triparma laevis f. inornata]